jgi:NADH-quinone oxidoreductase subunit N
MTLSTPILWVFFPLLIAAISGVFHKRKLLSILLTSLTSFSLAMLATFFSENMILSIGPMTLRFADSLTILGRQITIAYEILPFITLLYAMTCIWSLGSGIAAVPELFRPISLAITSLLTAALGVEPFLYAALFAETAVLVSVPMLSPIGQKTHRGILRYLTIQTLALPLILLAGWLLSGVETLPSDSPLVTQTMLVLGLGIAVWLSVFPFHSWMPMVSEKANPLVIGYLFFIMPSATLIFGLNFIDRYTFLRELPGLYEGLRLIGVIMIVIGGAWTAFQTNLKRAFSFSVLSETGISLLAIGLSEVGGLTWMLALFPIRALEYWLWGYILSLIEDHTGSLEIQAVQGLARKYPILAIGLLIVQLSVAGFPLLAAFPIKIALMTATLKSNGALGGWCFAAALGLVLFSVRLLSRFVTPKEADASQKWLFAEKPYEYLPVLIVILFLIISGFFPNTFFSRIINMLSTFNHLQ